MTYNDGQQAGEGAVSWAEQVEMDEEARANFLSLQRENNHLRWFWPQESTGEDQQSQEGRSSPINYGLFENNPRQAPPTENASIRGNPIAMGSPLTVQPQPEFIRQALNPQVTPSGGYRNIYLPGRNRPQDRQTGTQNSAQPGQQGDFLYRTTDRQHASRPGQFQQTRRNESYPAETPEYQQTNGSDMPDMRELISMLAQR